MVDVTSRPENLEELLNLYIMNCVDSPLLEPYGKVIDEFGYPYKFHMFKFRNENLYLTIRRSYLIPSNKFDCQESGTWFWIKNPERIGGDSISMEQILEKFNKDIKSFILFNLDVQIKPANYGR